MAGSCLSASELSVSHRDEVENNWGLIDDARENFYSSFMKITMTHDNRAFLGLKIRLPEE